MPRPKLRGLSEILTFFRKNQTPVFFVSPTAFNLLGVEKFVGSLETGKDADFALWSGDPLSTYSRCEATWIDGREYFSIAQDKQHRDHEAGADDERRQLRNRFGRHRQRFHRHPREDAAQCREHLHQRLERDAAAQHCRNRQYQSLHPDPSAHARHAPATETVVCDRFGTKQRDERELVFVFRPINHIDDFRYQNCP